MAALLYNFPTKIYFGENIAAETGQYTAHLGNKALLVTSGRDFHTSGLIEKICSSLKKSNINILVFDEVSAASNSDTVDIAASLAKSVRCDFIIGLGGCKVQNIARAISVICTNEGESSDFLSEQDGYRLNIATTPLPVVSIPTSYGTLSETGFGFVIQDKHDDMRKKMYSEKVCPAVSIVDPALCLTLPKKILSSSGLMVLAYCIELYTSRYSNPVSDACALRAMELISSTLGKIIEEPDNLKLRTTLSMASLLCALAAACGKLGTLYVLSHAVASVDTIYRGTLISAMLPNIMEYNLTVSSGKYVQLARIFGEDVKDITVLEAAIKAVEKVRMYVANFNIPAKLSDLGFRNTYFDRLYAVFSRFEENNYVPREITKDELKIIIEQAY